jgi:SAM-dependent methyltransferase
VSLLGAPLEPADVEVFDSSVVPRYVSFFGSLAIEMLLPFTPARVAHFACRTGYPDAVIADKLPDAEVFGVDASPSAIDLARQKSALLSNVRATYDVAATLPSALPEASFTHALALSPLCDADGRALLLSEMRRVLMVGGQALLALPLRGSFPEINDMIREFALRQDLTELGQAIEVAAQSRPTIETVAEEFENAGLGEVDVDVQLIAVSFNNGREFLEDPIARYMVMPEAETLLHIDPSVVAPCLKYVHDAILKYWSEGVFELTVNVGCASGRRMG